MLSLLFIVVTLLSFSQKKPTYDEMKRIWAREEQKKEDDKYAITIGTSRVSATNGMQGFTTNDNDIRIVGYLHRGNKIEYEDVLILTRLDDKILDSQVVACTGIHKKWRDFIIQIPVVYSTNYSVEIYGGANREILGIKTFFIQKK